MRHGDRVDDELDAARLRPRVVVVLEIDVVDDLGDRPYRGLRDPEPREQHLEGAQLALVRVFAVEHVEAEIARTVAVFARGDELEPGLRIDEAADEPRARHAIHVDPGARHPRPRARLLLLLADRSFPRRLRRLEPAGELGQEPLERLAGAGEE